MFNHSHHDHTSPAYLCVRGKQPIMLVRVYVCDLPSQPTAVTPHTHIHIHLHVRTCTQIAPANSHFAKALGLAEAYDLPQLGDALQPPDPKQHEDACVDNGEAARRDRARLPVGENEALLCDLDTEEN